MYVYVDMTGEAVGERAGAGAGRMSRGRRSERFTAEGSGAAAVRDRDLESQDESLDRTVQQI